MKERTQNINKDDNLLLMKRIDMMLDTVLPNTFSSKVWSMITRRSPEQFLATQEEIMMTLLSDYPLFKFYFHKLYHNHLRLSNWCLLAHQNQQEIKQYVFKNLLAQNYKTYQDRFKDQQLKNQFTKSTQLFPKTQNIKFHHKEKNLLTFHRKKMGKIKFQIKDKNRESQKKQLTKSSVKKSSNRQTTSIGKQDYHQLFLQTFHACDGDKYIYYDFNRHMQGSQQMSKYNEFIRVKSHKRLHSSLPPSKSNMRASEITCKNQFGSTHLDRNQLLLRKLHTNDSIRVNNFTIDPIGFTQNRVFKKQLMVFRKMPNLFKRAKTIINNTSMFRKNIF